MRLRVSFRGIREGTRIGHWGVISEGKLRRTWRIIILTSRHCEGSSFFFSTYLGIVSFVNGDGGGCGGGGGDEVGYSRGCGKLKAFCV